MTNTFKIKSLLHVNPRSQSDGRDTESSIKKGPGAKCIFENSFFSLFSGVRRMEKWQTENRDRLKAHQHTIVPGRLSSFETRYDPFIVRGIGNIFIRKSYERFFQQETDPKDWWKTTFVTPHRGLEWLTISNMNLGNTPGFFQSRLEKIFGEYLWKFVLVYMDDIIIYSRNMEDHLRHLDEVLDLLRQNSIVTTMSIICSWTRRLNISMNSNQRYPFERASNSQNSRR